MTQDKKISPSPEIIFLGTGTSVGVPMIACDCPVCQSLDPRDKRLRCSLYIKCPEVTFLIDSGPDLRAQCLREEIKTIDAAIITHEHVDHIMGFDELRRFTPKAEDRLPVYALPATQKALQRIFPYLFDGKNSYPGYFKPELTTIDGSFTLGENTLTPLPVKHGRVDAIGFLLERGGKKCFAYIPDAKELLPEAIAAIEGVPILIIDALRHQDHPTHLTFEESATIAQKCHAKQTWFTHISHEILHIREQPLLPENIQIAWDGLRLSFPGV